MVGLCHGKISCQSRDKQVMQRTSDAVSKGDKVYLTLLKYLVLPTQHYGAEHVAKQVLETQKGLRQFKTKFDF
jgi:hypothetical protein